MRGWLLLFTQPFVLDRCLVLVVMRLYRCANLTNSHAVYIFVIRWIRSVATSLLLVRINFFIDVNNVGMRIKLTIKRYVRVLRLRCIVYAVSSLQPLSILTDWSLMYLPNAIRPGIPDCQPWGAIAVGLDRFWAVFMMYKDILAGFNVFTYAIAQGPIPVLHNRTTVRGFYIGNKCHVINYDSNLYIMFFPTLDYSKNILTYK